MDDLSGGAVGAPAKTEDDGGGADLMSTSDATAAEDLLPETPDAAPSEDDSRSDDHAKMPEPTVGDAGTDAGMPCSTVVLTPQAAGNVASGGRDWSNPTFARLDDELRAEVIISDSTASNDLVVSNFGAAIPSDATIKGLVLDVDRGGGQCVLGRKLALKLNGIERQVLDIVGRPWEGILTVGSPTNSWGGLKPSDVNTPTFGVAMKVSKKLTKCYGTKTGRVDAVRIQITFCKAGTI